MDDTKEEKIKQFNKKQQERETQKLAEKKPVALTDKQEKAQEKQLTNEELIAKKAQETKEARKEQEKQETEQKKKEEQEAQKTQDAIRQTGQIASTIADNVNDKVNPMKQWIASQPTPGGIMTILLILLFFVAAIVPVNSQGQTRLQLLWLSLTGKTHLSFSGAPTSVGLTDAQKVDVPTNTSNIQHGGPDSTDIQSNGDTPQTYIVEPINIMSFFGMEQ